MISSLIHVLGMPIKGNDERNDAFWKIMMHYGNGCWFALSLLYCKINYIKKVYLAISNKVLRRKDLSDTLFKKVFGW